MRLTKPRDSNPGDESTARTAQDLDETTIGTTSVGDREAAAICLTVSRGGPIELYDLPELEELTIGRGSACDIRIDEPEVSRVHAVLRSGDGLYIKDANSANGTLVNQERLPSGEWQALRIGSVVSIGSAHIVAQPKRGLARQRRVWGHGHFEARVEEEHARCERGGGTFAILRVTTPRDLSATRVEGVFAASLRASDILARYAPGDYEVLLVGLDTRRAATAANRLMDDLSNRLGCAREQLRFAVACYPRDASSPYELLDLANRAMAGIDETGPAVDALAGSTEGFRAQVARIARSTMSVLLVGETGVGKEVFARLLHEQSPRADQKMLRLNCAALTETLLESELFGFEKGAFTGAGRAKPGLLETADKGTVLLDEIGEMPLSTQVKLLRVLEEREVQRIGALAPRPIDVRFLAATNRDLEAEAAAGRFRQDLLFRINAFTLRIPSLRERQDEIEPLARYFAARAAEQFGGPTPMITERALDALRTYTWPGNVRELRNVIERAVVLADQAAIDVEHLPIEKMNTTVLAALVTRAPGSADASGTDAVDEDQRPTVGYLKVDAADLAASANAGPRSEEDAEKARILDALDRCAGNQTRAARLLGISRGTLVARLDRYGIPRPRKGR